MGRDGISCLPHLSIGEEANHLMHLHEFLADPDLVAAGFSEAVVWEPDHSRARLREFEVRYRLSSSEVYAAYKRGLKAGEGLLTPITSEELAEWVHYCEIALANAPPDHADQHRQQPTARSDNKTITR